MPANPALWTKCFPSQIRPVTRARIETRKRLPKVSKKRQRESRVYAKLRKEFVAKHLWCMRCGKHIPKERRQVHHFAGRRSNYLKVETFRLSCNDCNMFAKEHPKEAIAENWRAQVGVYKV